MKYLKYLPIIALIFFLKSATAQAASFPAFPMSFWGNVTLNSGPAPKGTVIKAYYDNALAGEITVQEAGVYGYEASTKQKLVVGEGVGAITFKFESPLFSSGAATQGTSINSYSGFASGQSINKDLSFSASGTSGAVDPTQLVSLLTDGTFAPAPGSNPSSTSKVSVIRPVVISVTSSGGSSSVNLPSGLQITRVDGSNIDSSALTASKPVDGSLTGLGSGFVLQGALQWGIPNQGLQFSIAITLNIFVGTELNGRTLHVLRSINGSSEWTDDGISDPGTCVVSSGVCTFSATKASYYAAAKQQPAAESSSSSSSGGGGGGSVTQTDTIPTNPTITINSGAAAASSVDVTLTLNVSAANQMKLWNDGGFDSAVWETYVPSKNWTLPAGSGIKSVFVQYKNSSGQISAIASDSITLSPASSNAESGQVLGTTTSAAHPNGTLILDGGTIFLIKDGKRSGFRNPEEYFSHGYAFSQAVAANDADRALAEGLMMKALEGTLVLDAQDGRTVNMIGLNGTKRGFTSATVFQRLGYSFKGLLKVDLSDYTTGPVISSGTEAHPEGALVLDKGTVWWIKAGQRLGFQSEAVFKTYGFTFGRVVAANAADMALPEGALVKFRDGTLINDQGAIYIISDGKKLGFRNMNALTSRGYQIKNAITAKLESYDPGQVIE